MALRMENDSYRDATGQLASQITALQGAVDAIGSHGRRGSGGQPGDGKAAGERQVAGDGRGDGRDARAMSVPGQRLRRPPRPPGRDRGSSRRWCAPASSGARRWRWRRPRSGRSPGWLSSPYGGRRDPFTGQDDFHPGLDISAPQGEAVLAPADADVSPRPGPAAITATSSSSITAIGIVTKYGHLSRFAVVGGPARQARRRHRLRRHDRAIDQPAPPLRNLDERPADQPDAPARAA